jgi:histidyl-tRNA synthetase
MSKQRGIVPRKIKGFRDIDPNLIRIRQHIVNAASAVYKLYGFEHWDTPVIEYADNLGKYMPDSDTIEQGVYSFRNPEKEPVLNEIGKDLKDENDTVVMENHHLALRYDLTAPLARHYAEKLWLNSLKGDLTATNAPLFRRFQYGPVFRYEAKLDPGRFREFWQLDFDTVGTRNVAADAEVCMILSEALEAIGLKRSSYIIKVNNRKILKGLLQSIGVASEDDEQNILRIIDKFDKIGRDGLEAELGKERKDESGAIIKGLNLDQAIIDKIMAYIDMFITTEDRNTILQKLKSHLAGSEIGEEGVAELETINDVLTKLDFGEDRIIFDPTLVRGMAYYTGPIFEVESLQTYKDRKGRKRKVGAICGGGRYDGLVEQLNGIQVPATGASIGVDRLAELLLLTEQAQTEIQGPVFIAVFDDQLMPEYQKIASELRQEGVATEIFYGQQKNMKKQLSYADKRNCPLAIMIGENEMESGMASVKDLILGRQETDISDRDEWRKRVQQDVERGNLVSYIKEKLNR